jgi:membrane protease YdiL (CAAX protease family)
VNDFNSGEGIRSLDDTAPPPRAGGRLWPVGIFLLLSVASSWIAWLWPVNERARLLLLFFGAEIKIPFFFLKLVIGNSLPGILAVIWVLCEGKDQLQHMLCALTKWKTPFEWYVVAFVLPWIVFLPALIAVFWYFPKARYLLPHGIDFFERFLVSLSGATLWEELAWRAFALRKLETRYSYLISSLILGVYWGVWHIPLWFVEFDSFSISFAVAAIANVIALSVIFGYLYHRSSESLPVVILLHTTYDVVATQASLLAPELDTYINSASLVLSACFAIVFGRALWRMSGTRRDIRTERIRAE